MPNSPPRIGPPDMLPGSPSRCRRSSVRQTNEGRAVRRWAIALAAMVAPATASADEFGGSVWLPGQNASFVAEPVTPGFSLEMVGYTGWGNQPTDSRTRGGHIVAGATKPFQYVFAPPGHALQTPVLAAPPPR